MNSPFDVILQEEEAVLARWEGLCFLLDIYQNDPTTSFKPPSTAKDTLLNALRSYQQKEPVQFVTYCLWPLLNNISYYSLIEMPDRNWFDSFADWVCYAPRVSRRMYYQKYGSLVLIQRYDNIGPF